MKRLILFSSALMITLLSFSQADPGKTLPVRLEELSSPQFADAVGKSGGVCVIPMGVIEKHGTHLPLGTDMFEARESVTQAAEKEYAVVFPPYFAGQIF